MNKRLLGDLRTDHAGETGAVFIYKGILSVSRDRDVRRFSEHHLATETEHLRLVEEVLPEKHRSRLIPLWRAAGWLTGAVPALFGPAAVYRTIDAVETFVDQHYQEQIDWLAADGSTPEILALLKKCQADEIAHRDEARAAGEEAPSGFGKIWGALVGAGSKAAVDAARVI
ncbi:MAG: demethoxyubiquinone hydroxylase family protein [Pseudomonadota bacterium]